MVVTVDAPSGIGEPVDGSVVERHGRHRNKMVENAGVPVRSSLAEQVTQHVIDLGAG